MKALQNIRHEKLAQALARGLTHDKACEEAGVTWQAHQIIDREDVQRRVAELQRRKRLMFLTGTGWDALEGIVTNTAAPPSSRVSAYNALGAMAAQAGDFGALAQVTAVEGGQVSARALLAKLIELEANMIDVTPSSAQDCTQAALPDPSKVADLL